MDRTLTDILNYLIRVEQEKSQLRAELEKYEAWYNQNRDAQKDAVDEG